MSYTKEKPAVQVAIDELQAEVKTPADQEVLAEWQKEHDAQRDDFLRDVAEAPLPDMVFTADGSIEKKEVAVADVENGNPSGPYTRGRR